MEQGGGTGISVRLEGTHHTGVAQALCHGEQGVELIGVVGVVVVHHGAVELSLLLEAASGPGKGGKALLHGTARNTKHIGGTAGGQSIGDIMASPHVESGVGIFHAVFQKI